MLAGAHNEALGEMRGLLQGLIPTYVYVLNLVSIALYPGHPSFSMRTEYLERPGDEATAGIGKSYKVHG